MGAVRNILREWPMVALLSLLLAGLATSQGWLWRLDQMWYDVSMLSQERAVDEDIVIVAIDDHSLSRLGAWPWSRTLHAALISRLHAEGARAVAMDLILSEPGGEADRVLAEAMALSGPVVLPVFFGERAGTGVGEVHPVVPLSEVARLGHIHVELDPDGIARSVYLWEGMGQARHPQLALALLQQAHPELTNRWDPPTQPNITGWARAQWLRIPFVGPPGSFRQIAYSDVLDGHYPQGYFTDAMVLVGVTAAGLGDALPVPTSGLHRAMPGVEVHANVLSALRQGQAVREFPGGALGSGVLAALCVLLLLLVILRASPRAALVFTLLALIAAPLLSLVLLWGFKLWWPPMGAVLAMSVAYPLWSWRRLEAAQAYLDAELRELQPGTEHVEGSAFWSDPLVARMQNLRELGERQRRLQRSREETLYFLSHDLRAPLASLLVLLGREQTPDSKQLARLERYAGSALQMTENLLRLIRAEGLAATQFKPLTLEMLVQDAVDEVWVQAEQHGVRLQLDSELPDSQPALVRGDDDLLVRAMANLLLNAIKFSPSEGKVMLRMVPAGDCWAVQVCDCGPGISEQQLSRLFRYFSREADSGHQGIGLGLLMVNTVLDRHGGKLLVESEPGFGSCFTMLLPVLEEE